MAIDVQGIDQVIAGMQSIEATALKRSMRAGLRAAGNLVKAEVELLAPERVMKGGDSLPVGALKADITLTVSTAKETGQQYAIVQPGKLTSHVARWVEYGHRMVKGGQLKFLKNGKTKGRGRVIAVGGKMDNVPAHPFIRPAFEATEKAVPAAFAAAFLGDLNKR